MYCYYSAGCRERCKFPPAGPGISDGHYLTKKVTTKSLTNFFSYTNSLTTFSSTSSLNSLTAFQLVTN